MGKFHTVFVTINIPHSWIEVLLDCHVLVIRTVLPLLLLSYCLLAVPVGSEMLFSMLSLPCPVIYISLNITDSEEKADGQDSLSSASFHSALNSVLRVSTRSLTVQSPSTLPSLLAGCDF